LYVLMRFPVKARTRDKDVWGYSDQKGDLLRPKCLHREQFTQDGRDMTTHKKHGFLMESS